MLRGVGTLGAAASTLGSALLGIAQTRAQGIHEIDDVRLLTLGGDRLVPFDLALDELHEFAIVCILVASRSNFLLVEASSKV